jgi:hypothetical protein
MKNLVIINCMTVFILFLFGCVTSGPNNLSAYYKKNSISAELYNTAPGFPPKTTIVDLKKYTIENPNNKIVVIFNHGTSSYKQTQLCRPKRNGVVLNLLDNTKLLGKTVTVFHLCSYSTGAFAGMLTPIRANEIELSVKYFLEQGVPSKNIFIFGQSRGAWSALYHASKNKFPELGGYVLYAPAICGPQPISCWSVIDEHIKLFKTSKMHGILFSHPNDPFFTPKEHSFARVMPNFKLKTDFCEHLSSSMAHGFYRRHCIMSSLKVITQFIQTRVGKI